MGNDEVKKRVLDDLDFATDRLSSQTRQIAFGVLAFVWALLVGEGAKGIAVQRRILLAVAAIALGALIADFLQYLSGYCASQRARRVLSPDVVSPYNKRWLSYRLRSWFFFIKIGLVLVAAIMLIIILVGALN